MSTLGGINSFLHLYFSAERFDDQNGIYSASDEALGRPIKRFGLMLEPFPKVANWTKENRFDALFIHRPWKLEKMTSPEVGILAYHYAFDELLTTGYNPRLADVLLMGDIEVIGHKEGRPLGMIGDIPKMNVQTFHTQVKEVFGGLEGAHIHSESAEEVTRVCVVGAMRDKLIREANERGANVYITGQYRDHAQKAVEDTGMNVLEIGHERCERWGLRALAGVLRERFAGLEVTIR